MNVYTKFLRGSAGWLSILALAFCACTKIPDYCGNAERFDFRKQFCVDGYAYDKCGGSSYNPSTQKCGEYGIENITSGGSSTKYTLTVNKNPTYGGTTTPASSQQNITGGTAINISAVEANDYTFDYWAITSGNGTIADASKATTTVTVNGHVTVTANFTQNNAGGGSTTYTLTVNRNPTAGGTTTPASSQQNITGGTAINISAVEASGYTFNNWVITSGNGTIADASKASTTVTVNGNVTVAANFTQNATTYTLTVNRNPTTGGTTTPASGQTNITAGTQVSISATAASGYTFNNWTITSGSGVIADASKTSTTITVNGNVTVAANFTQNATTYTLTVNRNPTSGGTTTPANSQTNITAGTQMSISATAAGGYTFSGWTMTSGKGTIADASKASTTITVNENVSVTANFTLINTGEDVDEYCWWGMGVGCFLIPKNDEDRRTCIEYAYLYVDVPESGVGLDKKCEGGTWAGVGRNPATIVYCDWGPPTEYGDGGCYTAESSTQCVADYGTVVSSCP